MSAQGGNGPRFAAVPLDGGGTTVGEWLAGDRPPPLDTTGCRRLIVVGAHPDDETLGFGGTSAQFAAAGVEVQVVSATDGGAAYPRMSVFDRIRLERTRRSELIKATSSLGLSAPIFLGLPDGAVNEHEDTLTDQLVEILDGAASDTWLAATWRGDGHPDHEAVGRAAAAAVTHSGATLLEYPVWMWHWATPGDPDVPWDRAYAVHLDRSALGRKQHAAQCFRSQFESTATQPAPLPPFVLRRLLAVGEVVFR
ncbi:PIG-L family deacetylase [Mycolicibacterium komossense]|uniref:PIG-L family deacetylase n=1 Tax=Mycolicibacterium komossense TaxID=1779 RepID=A0ABT3CLJ0_9MYCO|nr:PIG-L deacetylase family protein [Mycolicibacterium komossense]MCV7230355.1 PIG-L family deacetylase [Mycolicibacterium komossense]